MTDQTSNTLLTFPCEFPIKVFGKNTEEFQKTVLAIIDKHVKSTVDRRVQSRPSENGKYLALNVTVFIDSKEQLDNIYRELSASPEIIMTL